MRGVPVLVGLIALSACAAHRQPAGPFRFEGLTANGEIRVVPVIHAYESPEMRIDGYVTDGIPFSRVVLRRQRMDELAKVPDQVATALPGAIHTRLDGAWTGTFRVGHLPLGARDRLEAALRRGDENALELALADVATGVGGEATLFSWITELEAEPITAMAFPGDSIETAAGMVTVDFAEEPYRVHAELGMALVTADGHVIIRYSDSAASLLSPHRNPARVGRDLASELAAEVVKMWPDDPRLWRHAPEAEPEAPLHVDPVATTGGTPQVPFSSVRTAATSSAPSDAFRR